MPKWSILMNRFNSTTSDTTPSPIHDIDRRRPSHASSCHSTGTSTDGWSVDSAGRKDCLTNSSSSTTKYLGLSSLFRRRGSNSSASTSLSSLTIEEENPSYENEYEKNIQILGDLCELALDEIKYAQDSRGTMYYSGDRTAAQEAMDNCTSTFMELQKQTMDESIRSLLQSTMTARLIHLQTKFDALPREQET